jgi:hypothetical protein
MEVKEHFENIREVILDNLKDAKKEIIIAMAWFTSHDIFELLLQKAEEIPIHLIVINDDINNRLDGLDFQKLINKGGKFYFGLQETPMHNKFCLIDGQVLITGSYNYTYLADSINSENIVVFKGATDIIEGYRIQFFKLISNLKPINSVADYLKNNPCQKDTFSFRNYGIRDIYAHTQLLKINGQIEAADSIIKGIEKDSEFSNTNNFQINELIYKQWKQDYYADKVQVLDNQLILYYRTFSDSSGCWLHGPKNRHAWTLRNSTKKILTRKATRITNIKIDGQKIITSTDAEEIYYFSKDGKYDGTNDLGYSLNEDQLPIKENGQIVPMKFIKVTNEKFELTCEIHFDVTDFPLETVDLIEGLGTDDMDNHWHCFDINLRLNRERL